MSAYVAEMMRQEAAFKAAKRDRDLKAALDAAQAWTDALIALSDALEVLS